jgi:hypothetical protein
MSRPKRWIIILVCAVLLLVIGAALVVVTLMPLRRGEAAKKPQRIEVVQEPNRAEAAQEPRAEMEYYALFMEGKKVGHATHTRAVEGGKVATTDDVNVTISRMGAAVTIVATETSIETPDGKPLGFKCVQQLGTMTMMKVAGTIDPNGTVGLVNTAMGTDSRSTMPWPAGAIMAEGLRLLSLKAGLEPGTVYDANVFSPSLMQAITTKVSIGDKKDVDLLGRVVKLTEMTSAVSLPGTGPITTLSYVDDDLQALKSSIPIAGMQVEMVSCTKEFAMSDNDVLDLIDKMFVKSPRPIEDVHSTASITYTLDPVAGADLRLPSTDNQQARRLPDGRTILIVAPVSAPTGGTFPYRGDYPVLLEALKPTQFLQSDRKEIVALARKAVGDAKDSTEAARRIESFVAEYIENRSLSVGYASAAEVAESRQGDCSEFAVLTAALCRAVGVPAQVVVGIAYVSDFMGIEGFGGHAWAQAWLGGKWVGLDAAFKGGGRGGYDAGHIALALGNGDPADFFNLATTLGQFKIEKLEIRRAK